MNFFSITRTKEGDYVGSEFDVIYIFSDVSEHKDEILDVIEKKKMCFKELDNYIKSLNGSIETVFLKDLVKNFVKRKLKNVEKSK